MSGQDATSLGGHERAEGRDDEDGLGDDVEDDRTPNEPVEVPAGQRAQPDADEDDGQDEGEH